MREFELNCPLDSDSLWEHMLFLIESYLLHPQEYLQDNVAYVTATLVQRNYHPPAPTARHARTYYPHTVNNPYFVASRIYIRSYNWYQWYKQSLREQEEEGNNKE